MKKILGLSMAVLMIASCAVGCGDSDGGSDGGSSKKKSKDVNFAGKWEGEKLVTDDGLEITDIFGIPLSVTFQFDFRENGTCVISKQVMDFSPDEEAPAGTWSSDGDKLTLVTADDDGEENTLVFEYKNDRLVVENMDEDAEGALYLVQVDEFTPFNMESILSGFDFGGLGGGDFDFDMSDFDF